MRTDLITRTGDDVKLRQRVVRASTLSIVAAVAVPVAGLILAARGPASPTGHAAAAPAAEPSSSSSAGSPLPTAPRIRLSATGTPSSPVVWRNAPGADRGWNAVVVAYETYVGTTVRLGEEPDPDDAALAQVAVEPQLRRVRSALATSAAAGLSRRGRVLATARVETVRGAEAVVVGCIDATAQRLYRSEDRVPRWRSGVSVSRVLMRRDDGRWKVYLLSALPAGRCRR